MLVLEGDIEEMETSPVSQMPLGLLNALSEAELLDLVAYMLSRGNPDDVMFAPVITPDGGDRPGGKGGA